MAVPSSRNSTAASNSNNDFAQNVQASTPNNNAMSSTSSQLPDDLPPYTARESLQVPSYEALAQASTDTIPTYEESQNLERLRKFEQQQARTRKSMDARDQSTHRRSKGKTRARNETRNGELKLRKRDALRKTCKSVAVSAIMGFSYVGFGFPRYYE